MTGASLFSSARFKLTLGYTLFFAVVFIFFSTLMYQVQVRTLERTRAIPPRLLNRIEQRFERKQLTDEFAMPTNPGDDQMRALAQERVDLAIADLKRAVFRALFIVNVVAISLGAGVAYLLAGYSLRPLESAYQKQKQFLQDISHELRTPLSVMQVELDVVDRQVNSQKANVSRQVFQKTITSLREEVSLIAKLVSDILQLTHLEQLDGVVHDQKTDLHKSVVQVVNQFEVMASEKKIVLKLDDETGAASELKVKGSPEQWQQLLRILVENALKYSQAKDKVTVRLLAQAQIITIQVEDTGIGISTQDIGKIFERFYRADKARTTAGNGLGLAIAQELATQLGATLTASSKLGVGSAFTIVVPAA